MGMAASVQTSLKSYTDKGIHLSRLLCRPLEDSLRLERDFESLRDLERLLSERLEVESEFFRLSWRRSWWSSCRRLSRLLLSLSRLWCRSRSSLPWRRSSRSLSCRRDSRSWLLRSLLCRWSRSRSGRRLSDELVSRRFSDELASRRLSNELASRRLSEEFTSRFLCSSSRLDSRSSFFLSADRLSRWWDASFCLMSLLTGCDDDVLLILVTSGLQSPAPSCAASADFSPSFPPFSVFFSTYHKKNKAEMTEANIGKIARTTELNTARGHMMPSHSICGGDTVLMSIWIFCCLLLFYPWSNFAKNVISSSVGGSDYLPQISSNFIQYSCKVK